MVQVTLSSQNQVEIPKEIVDSLHLQAGQTFDVVLKEDFIALVPQQAIPKSLRGILKGANIDNVRDHY
jgi:AbrB family looped-hinge helix DNA binding protein